MTKRMAMGMSQPAGKSRSFSEKGLSFYGALVARSSREPADDGVLRPPHHGVL